MAAAAKAASVAGEDFAGQYRAALAASEKAAAGRKVASTRGAKAVSAERGEELLADLESGLNSMVARELFQHILAAEKRQALAIMRDERMSDENAQDLYTYCRAKWLDAKLAVVEVPRTSLVGFIREAEEQAQQASKERPQYLVRQGLSIVPCRPYLRNEPMTFLTSSGEIDLKEVKQLWMVVQNP
jgi:hypothetical protein